MPKFIPKQAEPIDVLVIGDHPSAHLAAMLLAHQSDLRVVLTSGSKGSKGVNDDRLVTLNPALFNLHPQLAVLKARLNLTGVYGLHFLAGHAGTASEHRVKSIINYVARYSDVQAGFAKLNQSTRVQTLTGTPRILGIDEHGLKIVIGKHTLHSRALVLADAMPVDEKKLLGNPQSWGSDVLHRFTSVRCKSIKHLNLSLKPLMPMSLDLRGQLCWGWLLPGEGEFQLTVEQPIEHCTPTSGHELLDHWVTVLKTHSILGQNFEFSTAGIQTVDLPLAGALAHEGVANRTLLIGPAGGFYSACGEEIYPCCWSAIFAAQVLKKALKAKHLQDALNPYRHEWRTTLGDYLRGPHQNLRFLLPLVYHNPAMTTRIAEAILLSKSVVR